MPSFKDANGREWLVSIDAPKIRAVREELQLDLIANDAGQFQRLQSDPVLLVDVLWVLCREQAGTITDRDFGAALVGNAIASATDALLRGIADFFPKGRREMLLRMITLGQEATAKAEAALTARIDQSGLGDRMSRMIEDEINRLLDASLTRFDAATSSPASSESSRTG